MVAAKVNDPVDKLNELIGDFPEWSRDVINTAFDAYMREMNVGLPGKVTEYDATTQTCTVQPMVQGAVPDANGRWVHETFPVIHSVPVMFMRSPSFTFTFPIPAGTTGQILFNQRDIGQWRATGQIGSPGDQTPHPLSGAVFWPSMAPNDSVVAVSNAHVAMKLNTGVEFRVGSATDFVANAALVDGLLDTLKTAIENTVVVAQDGGASFKSTLLTALASWPSSVAVTKLKSE